MQPRHIQAQKGLAKVQQELGMVIPEISLKKERRIDAAAPSHVEIGHRIDLLVQVRLPDSPLLGIDDWPTSVPPLSVEQATESAAFEFPIKDRIDPALPIEKQLKKLAAARIEIKVIAPDFKIEGASRQLVEVPPDQHSKRITFLLTALKTGKGRINVEVYSIDNIYLGTIPIETTVGEVSTAHNLDIANLSLFITVEQRIEPSLPETFQRHKRAMEVKLLKIVVASPGDVQGERNILDEVVKEVNQGVAADRGLRLDVVRWETDTHPGFHNEGPQGLIDSILQIEDRDILIGIFWKRFGTPTKDAQSGTEYEIRKAHKTWLKTSRPQIMVYFNQKAYSPTSKIETDQWGQVLKFKDEFPTEGLWWNYDGQETFGKLVRKHLTSYIRRQYELSGVEQKQTRETQLAQKTKDKAQKSVSATSPKRLIPQPKSSRLTQRIVLTVLSTAILILSFLIHDRISRPAQDEINPPSLSSSVDNMISIYTESAGATVILNGDSIGITPIADISIKAGLLSLHIQKKNYFPIDTSFVFGKGQDTTLQFTQQPAAMVAIEVIPFNTVVVLDDARINAFSLKDSMLAVGFHRISISLAGYQSIEKQFSLTQGTNPVQYYQLQKIVTKPEVSAIWVNSKPTDAAIYLDDSYRGITPQTVSGLEVRNYRLRLQKEGFQEYTSSVMVQSAQTDTIEAMLTPLTGKLVVEVKPSGLIYIDKKLQPKNVSGPYTTNLPIGSHELKVTSTSSTWTKIIKIVQGKTQKFEIDFDKKVTLKIKCFDTSDEPIPANIFVDNKNKGETPKKLTLYIGQHTVTVKHADYVTVEGKMKINLEENLRNPLKFTLKKKE